jgi:hypothetical protein
MNAQEKIQRNYMIAVRQAGVQGLYVLRYVPRGLQQIRTSGKAKRMPEYKATADLRDAGNAVTWEARPVDQDVTMEEFSADAGRRTRLAHDWLTTLSGLIETIDGYMKELGWETKKIDKPMEDSEIGKYTAPALLLQEETTKMLLEPITRSAPGTEGVVDLYLMPGYDDIASLYYNGKKWNLHYCTAEQKAVGNLRDGEAKPLTKASIRKVLEEMRANAQ